MSDATEPKSGTPAINLPEGLEALGAGTENGNHIVGKNPYVEPVAGPGEVIKVWKCKEKCFHNGRLFKRGDYIRDVRAPNPHFEGYVMDATEKKRIAAEKIAEAERLMKEAEAIEDYAETGEDAERVAAEEMAKIDALGDLDGPKIDL